MTCTCGHQEHEHERCDFPSRDDCTVCTCAHFIDADFVAAWRKRLTARDETSRIQTND